MRRGLAIECNLGNPKTRKVTLVDWYSEMISKCLQLPQFENGSTIAGVCIAIVFQVLHFRCWPHLNTKINSAYNFTV